MQRSSIDEEHHVSRYCKPASVSDGLPLGSAFTLRNKENCLSVNWLEYYGSDLDKAIECVRQAFQNKQYSLSHKGIFAVLRAGEVKSVILKRSSAPVFIKHQPSKHDPSHSGICGHPDSDPRVLLDLAKLVQRNDVYPARL
jgi:hypothetical protein